MPGSEEKGEEAKSSGDGKPFVDSTAVAIEAGSTSASKKDALRPKNADGDQNGGVKPEPEAGRAGEDHDDEEHYNEDEDDEDGDEGNLNSKWEETFKRLQVFKERHGHCLVPNRYQEDPQLGSWVSTQRRQYKIFASGSDQSTPMTAERARRLEGIGFQWSTRDPRHVPWEKRYGELLEFIVSLFMRQPCRPFSMSHGSLIVYFDLSLSIHVATEEIWTRSSSDWLEGKCSAFQLGIDAAPRIQTHAEGSHHAFDSRPH